MLYEQNDILYQDPKITVSLLRNPRGEIIGDEHQIILEGENPTRYILQRHVLETLAKSQIPQLEKRLEIMHPGISYDLAQRGITTESISIATSKAYLEERRQFEEWKKENPNL